MARADAHHVELHLLRTGRNAHVHTDEEKWVRFRQRVRTDDDVVALLDRVRSAIHALKGKVHEKRLF